MPKHAREDEDDIDIDNPPIDINPYEVLGVETSASQDDIKKAYRKAALRHHPDKASPDEKEAAHTKFQEIAFAFAILSNERRRKRYDTTGRTEESLDLDDDDFNWVDFFRGQFEAITTDKINDFSNEYKGSEEERQAVLQAYTQHKGKLPKLYQQVMLSDMVDDEDRFRTIIDAAIEAGEVEAFSAYTDETEKSRQGRMKAARKRKEKESAEAEEFEKKTQKKKAKKDAGGDMGDLAALIQQRQGARKENFLDNLEAKYAAKKGKKGAPMEEPPEEAFEKNRANKKAKR